MTNEHQRSSYVVCEGYAWLARAVTVVLVHSSKRYIMASTDFLTVSGSIYRYIYTCKMECIYISFSCSTAMPK